MSMKLVTTRSQVCRHAKERKPQVADLSIAEVFGKSFFHPPAVGQGDQGECNIRQWAGVDKCPANPMFEFIHCPAHRHSQADDSAHRHATDKIDRDVSLTHSANCTDVGISARRATRKYEPDGLSRDDPSQSINVASIAIPDLK